MPPTVPAAAPTVPPTIAPSGPAALSPAAAPSSAPRIVPWAYAANGKLTTTKVATASVLIFMIAPACVVPPPIRYVSKCGRVDTKCGGAPQASVAYRWSAPGSVDRYPWDTEQKGSVINTSEVTLL